jgi:hypothetical protein
MSKELDAFEEFESKLQNHPFVQNVRRVGGEERIEAGHENSSTSYYDVHLSKADVAVIAAEQADGVAGDPFSDRLNELNNFVELTLGGGYGDYRDGVLHVEFTYHR